MTATNQAGATPNAKGLFKRISDAMGPENLSLVIALIVMVALINTQTEYFFSARNLFNIAQNMAVVGLIAV